MRVLSIDVGMRHLAHCLLQIDGTTTIQDWGVHDITNSECCFRCSKPAFFETSQGKVCKPHAPNLPTLHALNKDELESLCAIHNVSVGSRTAMRQALARLKKKVRIQPATTVDLARSLATVYATLPTPDVVLIENQMASRMAVVQGMVIQYWVMRQVSCIEVVSPASKLQCLKLGKTTYAERKKSSVQYAAKLMDELNIEFEVTHKKRDDLADTFLQAMWWLKKNKHL